MVTHPEAEHHISRLVGGWHDSALTEHGRTQATAVAHRLRVLIPGDEDVEVFSSDLLRTRETAQIVAAELDAAPNLDERLREKSYGVAEGRPQQWLDERFIVPPAVGDRMHHREGIDGAETRHDIASRIYAAVDDILRSDCRHQVIVTHGFAHTFVVAAWIRMPLESVGHVVFRSGSGAITVLHEDDHFHNRSVETLGDGTHLYDSA